MDFYFSLCVILFVFSGSSAASLRIPRQIWPDSFMGHDHGHFHFPDQPVPERLDTDEFNNDVFGFPDMVTRPGGMGTIGFGPGFRPRPTSSSQWSNGNDNRRPSEGNGQKPDFSNNPWLSGFNNQGQNGGNNKRPSNGNNGSNSSRKTSTTTPSTTTGRTSTPKTFHLAPEGCDCPSTPQFNPVCGSDGNTYKNAGLLKCFRLCGIDVSQRRMGAC